MVRNSAADSGTMGRLRSIEKSALLKVSKPGEGCSEDHGGNLCPIRLHKERWVPQ